MYSNYDAIYTYFQDYKSLTIGHSYLNLPIKVFHNQAMDNKKPIILIQGGIHAREWISVVKSEYTEQIELINQKFNIVFLPVLNIDGYNYSFKKDRLWRKNRQTINGRNKRKSRNCVGIDLNRNWSFHWDTKNNKEPCQESYNGNSPFEAVELQHLKQFLLNQTNIISYIDFHAYGQLFMYPYGYTCDVKNNTRVNNLHQVGLASIDRIQQVHHRKYKLGSVCNTIYKAAGGGVDWAFHEANIKYPYAIELRGNHEEDYGFLLPSQQIIPTAEETLLGLIEGFKKMRQLEEL
ncbi:peptidase M14, carboxypeptidase A [Neoconidiobolus thromboides FSU 785]|nr:peptidase M14, carboxypeptidase A [Neoconidiobolus thromboides FSU 785]